MANKSKNRRLNEWEHAWFNALNCDCSDEQAHKSNLHKLCLICKKLMHKEVKINEISSLPHNLAWNKDHIKAIANGGTNKKSNLIAMHPWCNQEKGVSNIDVNINKQDIKYDDIVLW